MNNIYIDLTGGVFGNTKEKFHGGASFSVWFCKEILNACNADNIIHILVNEGQKSFTQDDPIFLVNPNIIVDEIQGLLNFHFEENSILIMPLIPSYRFKVFKQLKNKVKGLKLHVVVHGVRHIDLAKYDKYDKYYQAGLMKIFPLLYLFARHIKSFIEKCAIRNYLKYADKIFTVSNNSLQNIVDLTSVSHIKYFNQSSQQNALEVVNKYNERYILFVNAGRVEKNFVRSLVAFCKYKKMNNDDTYLYATGADDDFKQKLYKVKGIDKEVLDKWVKCLGFVSSQELFDLYSQSQFLLYTSKSEGYGIPLAESCYAGRPVVASYVSSIPEVLGTVVYYVNPYDENAIAKAIGFMLQDDNLNYYSTVIKQQREVLKQQQEIDKNIVIKDVLS